MAALNLLEEKQSPSHHPFTAPLSLWPSLSAFFLGTHVWIFFACWYTHQGVGGWVQTALLSARTTFFSFWKPLFLNGGASSFFDLPWKPSNRGFEP